MDQFFGKTTWRVFAGLGAATILGALLLRIPEAHVVALVLLVLLGAWSYWRKPTLAFVLVFAELFAFSHGKLFEMSLGGFVFTSRMALFVGIMLAWGVMWLMKKRKLTGSAAFWTPWVFLGIGLTIGLIVGLLNNEIRSALDDFNGYIYALYLLPLLSMQWDRRARGQLLQTLTGATLWMAVLSLALLYTFTHLPNEALELTYKFIRDARIGEITLMEGGYWRVFIQSQIVFIPALLLGLSFDTELPRKPVWRPKLFVFLALIASGLLISLSRSFWIGLIAAIPVMGFFLIRVGLFRQLFRRGFHWVGAIALALGLLATMALTVFPVPSRVVDLRETFSERTTETGDLAISSRWNLLPVMVDSMREAPILGSGFGEELAFISDDPRVRDIYPDGKWRTYKFEWGWLDLWIKMGALGFFAFVMVFLTYDRLLRESLSQPLWLRVGLRATLIALVVTHVFSPYLNHPLGIGLLLFVTVFLEPKGKRVSELVSTAEQKLKVPNLTPPVPTMRQK